MFATSLRLLLCLCLLLDAVAPAVAASRMALGALPHHAAAPSAAAGIADAAPPAAHDCGHGDGAAAPPAIAVDDASAGAAQGEREDCLRVCLELCLQNGHALAAPVAPMPALPPATGALPFDGPQAAAAPAFPPIRPPIG